MSNLFSVSRPATLSTLVANGGTFVLPYGGSDSSSTAWDTSGHILCDGQGNVYTSGFSVSFDAGGITVTNDSLGSLAAGRTFRLEGKLYTLMEGIADVSLTEAGAAILDDASADAQLATLGGAAPTGTGGLVRKAGATLTGTTTVEALAAGASGSKSHVIGNSGASTLTEFTLQGGTDAGKGWYFIHKKGAVAKGFMGARSAVLGSGTSDDWAYYGAAGVGHAFYANDVLMFTLSGTGVPSFAAPVRNSSGVGTAGTGVSAVEYGDGQTHQTVLSLATVLPAIAGGADLGVGVLIYTLPAGAQVIESAYMSVSITQTEGHIDADTPDVGLGTVIASGAVAVLGGTATFEDIITGQTAADCAGTATVKTSIPTAGVSLIREAGDAKTIYLNVADGWAASGDAAALLGGTVVINWRTMA